jgi:hypothetical protein
MSGLLRRIKRSRTAGAGEPPADEQGAAPEGAGTTAETAPAGDEAKTTRLPVATPPAIAADPDTPAGLDERVAAASQPPAGRRGRLRRRLRYLRRARELMLRDLGGLVYEVHRSGGGDLSAHRGVVDGKIERLVVLDAETGAIENALGAPRSETVVFEPGVGGTCDVCGELYGSAARFCSRCGTPTDPAARETPAPTGERRQVPPMPRAPGTGETAAVATGDAAAKTDATAPLAPVGAGKPAGDAAKVEEPAGEAKPPADAEEPKADETAPLKPVDRPEEPKTAELEPGKDAPADAGSNPFRNVSNGRPEEKGEPPTLSDGDPLAARESRK